MKTHRESFPEQYGHPYVGKLLYVRHHGKEIHRGIATRVVQSKFGQLVHFEGTEKAYRAVDCEYVTEDQPSDIREKS